MKENTWMRRNAHAKLSSMSEIHSPKSRIQTPLIMHSMWVRLDDVKSPSRNIPLGKFLSI